MTQRTFKTSSRHKAEVTGACQGETIAAGLSQTLSKSCQRQAATESMEGPREGVIARRQRKGLPTEGLLKSPHACTACPPNLYFWLTSATPMLGRKGTGVQAWALLPHGAQGGWARKGTTGCSGAQRRSWGTAKSKSIPGPSRESSGTETNGLIRLFKWIIVSSSFQMDSARLTKGPRLHLMVTCAL